MSETLDTIKKLLDRKEGLLISLNNAQLTLKARGSHIERLQEVAKRGVLDASKSLGFERKKESEDAFRVKEYKDALGSVEKEIETIKISSHLDETSKLLEELIAIRNSNQQEKLVSKDELELSQEWFDERYDLLFVGELKNEFVIDEIKRTKSCIEQCLSPKVDLKDTRNREYLELAQQYLSYIKKIQEDQGTGKQNSTLSLREIALLYYFKGEKITIHNQDVYANRHGQENIGQKLYSEYYKRFIEDDKAIYQHRYGRKNLESIKPLLADYPKALISIESYINKCD